MALLDGGAERSAEGEPSVLKNPTILVVQDFLVVLARSGLGLGLESGVRVGVRG